MADTPISHPNLSLMTFSGNDPNQNATAFWNSRPKRTNRPTNIYGTTIPSSIIGKFKKK